MLHLQVGNALLERYFGLGCIAAHALDVASGAKGIARARYQKRTDLRIIAALLDHAPQRRGQAVRQRVTRLGTVERDKRDAIADFAQ